MAACRQRLNNGAESVTLKMADLGMKQFCLYIDVGSQIISTDAERRQLLADWGLWDDFGDLVSWVDLARAHEEGQRATVICFTQ